MDNVSTSTAPLSVSNINKQVSSLNIVATGASGEITLWYSAIEDAVYQLHIYDMVGRQVYNGTVNAHTNLQKLTIDNNLQAGLYIVKMANKNEQSIVKLVLK